MKRREFIHFLGKSAAVVSVFPVLPALAKQVGVTNFPSIEELPIQSSDAFELANGFEYSILAKEGQQIGQGINFGSNNDYLAFFPNKEDENKGLLWVNHEYYSPYLVSGFTGGERTKEQWEQEYAAVGGSILQIEKKDGKWQMSKDTTSNKRLDGSTPIPIMADEKPFGGYMAHGTFGNCAGGITPWGTVLTCEEGHEAFYGKLSKDENGERVVTEKGYKWNERYNRPPEHYGWVVEVNPNTGSAKKHTSLGRFQHECATVVDLGNGFVVVYSGDDDNDEHLYKFINTSPYSLQEGNLYVADLESKQWKALDYNANSVLKNAFSSELDMLVYCREAAKLVGATPLDRPEDIEVHPRTGAVIVSCSNNKKKGNMHGHLLRIDEKGGDHTALEFEYEYYLAGGKETGFSCPDNLAFDRKGNLWLTTDISGSQIGNETYEFHGNNALFVIPAEGAQAGMPIRIATAPKEAELTGPFFAPDNETLFLSIQHPGESSSPKNGYTSTFPDGEDKPPKSCVVAITGEKMKEILR